MSEPFIAEIKMFPFNFAPHNWAWCDGQSVPVSQNGALYSIINNLYGGDAKNMTLPNLKGRTPLNQGQGTYPGASKYHVGESGGDGGIALADNSLPNHNHKLNVSMQAPTSNNPANLYPARHEDDVARAKLYRLKPNLPLNATLDAGALTKTGGDAHENRQPYLVIPFCICLIGLYPARPVANK